MKKKCCLLILVLAVFLSSCGVDFDDSAIRQEAAAVLDGLIAGDYDAVRDGLSSQITDSDLRAVFASLSREMEGLGEYEISPQEWRITNQDGVKLTAIRYLVTAGQTRFVIDVTKVEGEQGISGFHVRPAEAAGPAKMSAGAIGWAVTGVGIAAWVFVLWMVVDCLRRKMKRKWLWVPLILLLFMGFHLSLIQGNAAFRVNFGLLLGLSNLTAYSDGSRALTLYLPLGAIAYFLNRSKLTRKEPVAEVEHEMEAL